LKAAEIALKLNPGSASRRYSLALSYARTGNMEKANEIFGRDFIEKHLDDATAVRLYTMFWTQQGENLDHVLSLAKKAFDENSMDLGAAQSLAEVLMKMEKEAEAVKVFGEQQIKPFWGDHTSLNTYAWFWAEQGGNLKHALKASYRSDPVETGRSKKGDYLSGKGD